MNDKKCDNCATEQPSLLDAASQIAHNAVREAMVAKNASWETTARNCTDKELIAFASAQCGDNQLIIELCDRLTHANMRLDGVGNFLKSAREVLKHEDP